MTAGFLGRYDGLLCDLDGVVYAGDGPVPGAVESLNALSAGGVPIAFVTNNASRSSEQVAEHLASLGVELSSGQVFGSASAGVALLQQHLAGPHQGAAGERRVLVAGSAHLAQLVEQAGYIPTDHAGDDPVAVIQGFDASTGWGLLAEACYAIERGALWIATNLDLTIPKAKGIAPGNGSMVNMVATATGRGPDGVAGKPEPVLFTLAADYFGLRRPLVVGDRLDTDIEGGNRAGFDTALVLTGIHQRGDAAAAHGNQKPNLVWPDLSALTAEEPA